MNKISPDLKPAPLGLRFNAFMIDFVLVCVAWFALQLLILFVLSFFIVPEIAQLETISESPTNFMKTLLLILISLLIFPLVFHFYFIHSETRDGQTFGKKRMGLKVVSWDGSPITKKQAIYRDLAKFYFELTLTLPLIYIYTNNKRLRFGDLWAKTIVIQVPQAL